MKMPIGWASYWNPSISFLTFSCSSVCCVMAIGPVLQLLFGRQLPEDDQIRGLEIVAVFGELLDRVAAIPEDAFVAVDVGDGAAAGRRVEKRRVVGHQPGVVAVGLDLLEIGGANRAFLDGDVVLLARAVVGNRQRISHRALSVVALVVDWLRVLRNRLGRHAIAAVDPPGKILKLAALAAEGNPGCLRGLAPAKNAHASRHGSTFY